MTAPARWISVDPAYAGKGCAVAVWAWDCLDSVCHLRHDHAAGWARCLDGVWLVVVEEGYILRGGTASASRQPLDLAEARGAIDAYARCLGVTDLRRLAPDAWRATLEPLGMSPQWVEGDGRTKAGKPRKVRVSGPDRKRAARLIADGVVASDGLELGRRLTEDEAEAVCLGLAVAVAEGWR